MVTEKHKAVVRAEFNKQAPLYASAAAVSNPERHARLLAFVDPPAGGRMLDVATGPGYIAATFASRCQEVIGIDLTPNQIAQAERLRAERGLDNVRFQVGDAENLPFPAESFDLVSCGWAFHHFPLPGRVLAEMARVGRAGGLVVLDDVTSVENPTRAGYHNAVERLRDPSHTRALPLSELFRRLDEAGLRPLRCETYALDQEVEGWLTRAQTPESRAAVVREWLTADAEAQGQLSGIDTRWQDGALHFTHTLVRLVARKP